MFVAQGFGNLWPLGVGFFLLLAVQPTTSASLGTGFRHGYVEKITVFVGSSKSCY